MVSSIIIAWSLELVAKELEAYTLNVTLPIVLPFGALLTPDHRPGRLQTSTDYFNL